MPDEQLPRVRAPFGIEQIESLNDYQGCGWFHAFTCPLRHMEPGPAPLKAVGDGWVCPNREPSGVPCEYVQGWAYLFMADGSWRQQAQTIETALAELRPGTEGPRG